MLYKQSDIGNYGTIAKIAVNVHSAANGILGVLLKIYIKQTELDTLMPGDPFDFENEVADATLVLDEQYFFNTTGWVEFPIEKPLNYSSGNILIYTETNWVETTVAQLQEVTLMPDLKPPGSLQCPNKNCKSGT